MKRIISKLLVLTIACSTLMSVMLNEVSAEDPTAPTKTSVKVVEDENSAEGRKVTVQMGSQYIPTGSTSITSRVGNILGSVYVQGYDYGNTTLTDEGVSSLVANGTTTPAHILDVTEVSFAGLKGVKTDWKKATIKDETAKTQEAKVAGNYLRIMPLAYNMNQTKKFGSNVFKNVALEDHATMTAAGAIRFTFYGYTQNVDESKGSEVTINSVSTPSFNASNLVSERGIPHKIDLVYTKNKKDVATARYRLNVFIDGVSVLYAVSDSGSYAGSEIETSIYTSLNLDAATFSGSLGTGNTDWIMFYDNTEEMNYTVTTTAELNKELLITPTYNSVSNTFRTDDYITGVTSDVTTAIKTALETTVPGDKVVEIEASAYDDVTKIVNITVAEPTVKLVDRITGEEIAYSDANGSMDKYYFMVNGIYVVPEKKVSDEITLSATVSGDKVTGVATMSRDKITDATLIVALFNGNDNFIKLIPTTEYTDSDTTRTMTCDLSGAESGYKYKVFLFESLASAVPLAEMVEGTID